jgi:hypothetical protein
MAPWIIALMPGVSCMSEHQDASSLAAAADWGILSTCAPARDRPVHVARSLAVQNGPPTTEEPWPIPRACLWVRQLLRRHAMVLLVVKSRGSSPPPRTSRRQDALRLPESTQLSLRRTDSTRVCLPALLHNISLIPCEAGYSIRYGPHDTPLPIAHTIHCGVVHTTMHHAGAGGRGSSAADAGRG